MNNHIVMDAIRQTLRCDHCRAQSRRQYEGDVAVLGYALPESAALLAHVQLRRTQHLTRLVHLEDRP